jgi:hypothetical protein
MEDLITHSATPEVVVELMEVVLAVTHPAIKGVEIYRKQRSTMPIYRRTASIMPEHLERGTVTEALNPRAGICPSEQVNQKEVTRMLIAISIMDEMCA